MPRNRIPEKFSKWNYLWDTWEKWHIQNPQYSKLQTCKFYKSISEIDQIIIGVQSLRDSEIIHIRTRSIR